jgi:hypothetical protein
MTAPDSPVADIAAELLHEAETALEALPAMLTAATAPADVAAWLRHVGRRPQGTKAALQALLEDRYGVAVEILDPGGTTWSSTAVAPPPSGPPLLVVRLHMPPPPSPLAVEAAVREAIPAPLAVRVEFTGAAGPPR